MSRGHVQFSKTDAGAERIVYELSSPDFSDSGQESKSLGKVEIDRARGSYTFTPSDLWTQLRFVLPEHSELALQTAEGIIYARRIHQSVKRMIEQNSYY